MNADPDHDHGAPCRDVALATGVSPRHGHGHDHDHDHDHDHGAGGHSHDLRAVGRRALLVAFVLNAGYLFVEAGVGWWSSSLALLSDAAHMLTDVIALSIALAAASIVRRPRSGVATFGHARFAVLGGLANALLALGAAIFIIVEAFARLHTTPSIPGLPVLVTATIGLIVNIASAWWLHRSGDQGVNMRGALVHMLGDALGSVAAIVAGLTLMLGGPLAIDPIASIVVAVIVAASAVPLLRDVVHILLERAPRGLDLAAIDAGFLACPEVVAVVNQHIWSLDDGETIASFVLSTHSTDLARLAAVADRLRETLAAQHRIGHATFEWRPVDSARSCCDDAAVDDDHGTDHPGPDHDDHTEHGHVHRHQPAS